MKLLTNMSGSSSNRYSSVAAQAANRFTTSFSAWKSSKPKQSMTRLTERCPMIVTHASSNNVSNADYIDVEMARSTATFEKSNNFLEQSLIEDQESEYFKEPKKDQLIR